ncbi:MAG: ferredoxin:glutaredoxin reductase [Methanomicrobiales archaeon HGW-Methanomicrobiales-4]|nr:MAG: ferredoxin:glutaredoxin reductase [Methanomicrobiales archaeon HGW-Methanomicrobiales-4]
MTKEITREAINRRYEELTKGAEEGGYHLNPDMEFTNGLIEGLLVNDNRFGYEACPCRLGTGIKEDDLDIICPCDYRDSDLTEYGACYCGLYLTSDVITAGQAPPVIPERRPAPRDRREPVMDSPGTLHSLKYPVWRCRVCGYLTARDAPPGICPICKAKSDRFEIFLS